MEASPSVRDTESLLLTVAPSPNRQVAGRHGMSPRLGLCVRVRGKPNRQITVVRGVRVARHRVWPFQGGTLPC
eukprot:scaffold1638_cov258-Pinguiococcus_pyrenoidosus.AAC.19